MRENADAGEAAVTRTAPLAFKSVPQIEASFWRGGLETAGPGCYDAVAIARAAGFRMLVMSRTASVMRRLSLNHSEPAKKSGQNIPKNRCRTTIAKADSGNTSGTAPLSGIR
jgi:hypothetical protein